MAPSSRSDHRKVELASTSTKIQKAALLRRTSKILRKARLLEAYNSGLKFQESAHSYKIRKGKKKRECADDGSYQIRILGGFYKTKRPESESDFLRIIKSGKFILPEGCKSSAVKPWETFGSFAEFEEELPTTAPAQSLGRKEIGERTAAAEVVKGAVGIKEKGLTSPAQSLGRKEIGERTAAAEVVKGAVGGKEKAPLSPAGGGSTLRAIVLFVFMAVVALAVPIFLLVRFHGHPMSQVWILSLSICSYVFFFLLFIWRSRPVYTELFRLSCGPLLAFCSASVICSATATFVLLFSMVWAAGNLGYSLAVHHLRNGTKPVIHAGPSPFCPTKDTVKALNNTLYIGAPSVVLLWTLAVVFFLCLVGVTNELYILLFLSYCGWIHVAVWLVIVVLLPVNGTPHEGPVDYLMAGLFPWMLISPGLAVISPMLAVLCHLLLMMALSAFLWYNLAIYMHFLAIAIPSTTTWENEDTLHSKILEGNIGQVRSDPRIGETPSEAAATLGNEDTLHVMTPHVIGGEIVFQEHIGGEISVATLGNEDTLHTEISEDVILEEVKSDPRIGETPCESAATLGNEDTLHVMTPHVIGGVFQGHIGGEISIATLGNAPSEAAATPGMKIPCTVRFQDVDRDPCTVRFQDADRDPCTVRFQDADRDPCTVRLQDVDQDPCIVRLQDVDRDPCTVRFQDADRDPCTVRFQDVDRDPCIVRLQESDNSGV